MDGSNLRASVRSEASSTSSRSSLYVNKRATRSHNIRFEDTNK